MAGRGLWPTLGLLWPVHVLYLSSGQQPFLYVNRTHVLESIFCEPYFYIYYVLTVWRLREFADLHLRRVSKNSEAQASHSDHHLLRVLLHWYTFLYSGESC